MALPAPLESKMAKQKVIVNCALGTFERETERPYTHVLVGQRKAEAIDSSAAWLQKYIAQAEHALATVPADEKGLHWHEGRGYSQKHLARLQRDLAKIEAQRGVFQGLSWHSSCSLAMQSVRKPWPAFTGLHIVEVATGQVIWPGQAQ